MNVQKIQTTQNQNNTLKHAGIAGGIGAVVGAGARYILPTKTELSSMFNKDAVDTFVSSTAASARGNNRSIVKYGILGAVAAAGLTLASKLFPKKDNNEDVDYSKMGALIDAPDYAVEIMWYGE